MTLVDHAPVLADCCCDIAYPVYEDDRMIVWRCRKCGQIQKIYVEAAK